MIFHQVVIGRGASRLQYKYVFAAYVFVDFNNDFAVGKFGNNSFAKREAELLGNAQSQIRIRVTGKNH